MKFAQIAKRVFLFAAVNILVLLTIHLVLSLLGLNHRFRGGNYETLLAFCFVWGMGGAFISLAMSRLMAKWFMGVQVIDPQTGDPQLREFVSTVHGLAQRAGLAEMPEVGIYDSPEVNAFATGPSRSRSLVAVSTGLLQNMNRGELSGVLGHEIAHIANGDMVTMTLIQGVINAFVMFFARIAAFAVTQAMRSRDDDRGGGFLESILVILFQIVFSLLGLIVVNAFSRWREFRADAGGAQFAGSAQMIGALTALQQIHAAPAYIETAHASGGESDSFRSLKIASEPGGLMNLLFASHPPIEERIARLKQAA
ncbi:MAG: protease HtpX [Verrucomicrobia bacterium]|nr:protease HtpX [Verrucomicrobiota bacterium]